MARQFEDIFGELQADMVSVALEYVENRANHIFIYCSNERGNRACDVFYVVNNVLLEKHKLNDVGRAGSDQVYDTSTDRQFRLLRIIDEDIQRIDTVCKEHGKEPPTQIKIAYDVARNKLRADFGYDEYYTNSPERSATTVLNEWFEEIQKQIKSGNS
ncbi:MAG: DUF600 domain-containing protein [Leptonema illini]|uniref:DUF600 domain-containing protein n=1 Tax=Leptonema illini TaxID=183 RepID=A0A833LUT5_9LEPT|nr:MAG: DUF600 domain-containing protein [Leptonema illini]